MVMIMRDIGLGIKPPEKEEKENKCPWCGSLKVRGKTFNGVVMSNKGTGTAVVQWDYYTKIPKYERYERRRTRISVHNPKCIAAKKGDKVFITECRPISKTKHFVIVQKM